MSDDFDPVAEGLGTAVDEFDPEKEGLGTLVESQAMTPEIVAEKQAQRMAGIAPENNALFGGDIDQAFAKGALDTLSAGTSTGLAAMAGANKPNDPNSPEFRHPYHYALGQTIGALIPSGRIMEGAGTLKGIIGRGAAGGAIYGAGQGLSEEAQQKQPELIGALEQAGEGAIKGAAMGALLPGALAGGVKLASVVKNAMSPEIQFQKIADEHLKILNPHKNVINAIEIKQGKDINKFSKLAAEEKLLYGKTPNNRLDTNVARTQVQDIAKAHSEAFTEMLKAQPKPINLDEIRNTVKAQLDEIINDPVDWKSGLKYVDEVIDTAKEKLDVKDVGIIPSFEANKLKQGMWGKSYGELTANQDKVSRQIGHAIKDAIEKAYQGEANIQAINQRIGDYKTLEKILHKANGGIIPGGRLGKYVAMGLGEAIGGHFGFLGRIIGPFAGKKINEYLTDPERLSTALAKRTAKLQKGLPMIATVEGKEIAGTFNQQFSSGKVQVKLPNGTFKSVAPGDVRVDASQLPRDMPKVVQPPSVAAPEKLPLYQGGLEGEGSSRWWTTDKDEAIAHALKQSHRPGNSGKRVVIRISEGASFPEEAVTGQLNNFFEPHFFKAQFREELLPKDITYASQYAKQLREAGLRKERGNPTHSPSEMYSPTTPPAPLQ